jgi:threonine/homoserine/homoserine lactone efflux protein
MDSGQAVTFVVACIGFGFVPGPALVQTVSLTLEHGRRTGLISVVGIYFGAIVQIGIAAQGLAVMLETSPWLYHGVRVVGGAYLIGLGAWRLRSRASNGSRTAAARGANPLKMLLSSMLVELLNPKSALFYLSFLMQFIDPSAPLGVRGQFMLMGTIANTLFSIANLIFIALANSLSTRIIVTENGKKIARWLSSAAFIGLGIIAIVA